MRYPVVWDPECFAQLDVIISGGAGFEELKQAVQSVDAELSTEPIAKGDPVSEGLRRLDLPPIRVYFHLDEASSTVIVDAIGRIGPA
jgi:hypothetical protein